MAGLVAFTTNAQLDARQAATDASQRQAAPLIVGLAAHLRHLWEPALEAHRPLEAKMLKALRQRNGEYEANKLSMIREQGGSEVFMMVTETKCRGAESWLRDILLDTGDVPWAIQPTPIPDLPPDYEQKVHERLAQKVIKQIQSLGQSPDQKDMDDLKEASTNELRLELLEQAQNRCDAMQRQIQDQFDEGNLADAFNDFLSDLTTYPIAWVKGPTVKRVRKLAWTKDPTGKFIPQVQETLSPTYRRIDPYRIYTEPGIDKVEDGYLFEHHRLTRSDLSAMIGVPGYDDDAIRSVLDNMPNGGTINWLWSAEMQKSELEQKHSIWRRPTDMCDALEFWGQVSGRLLIEWGMTAEEIPDQDKEYDVNAWMIGRWIIKATLNYDPLGIKPYYATSFIKRPGSLVGISIPEIIEDIQNMCNSAARALNNNMGIASGPQVEVNIDRLPEGEDITQISPWKIWQTTNDPLGNGQPAINFSQPDDRAQPLMMVYQHFAKLADDQSGIPAYIYGDMQVGGAGRTASGLSMLMGSAGKGIRQVIMHVDNDLVEPLVSAQYSYNMRYLDDENIKGDAVIIAKGATNLANREQLNVRRVEFLQATANEIDQGIIKKSGRASILREVAKGLSMPVDDIVPSKEEMDIQDKLDAITQQAQQAQATQANQQAPAGKGVVAPTQNQATNTFPGGMPMGGGAANLMSNQMTGKAA